ncbi:hypothetical protein DSO57_1028234, partial [Entomophthora muscae]
YSPPKGNYNMGDGFWKKNGPCSQHPGRNHTTPAPLQYLPSGVQEKYWDNHKEVPQKLPGSHPDEKSIILTPADKQLANLQTVAIESLPPKGAPEEEELFWMRWVALCSQMEKLSESGVMIAALLTRQTLVSDPTCDPSVIQPQKITGTCTRFMVHIPLLYNTVDI